MKISFVLQGGKEFIFVIKLYYYISLFLNDYMYFFKSPISRLNIFMKASKKTKTKRNFFITMYSRICNYMIQFFYNSYKFWFLSLESWWKNIQLDFFLNFFFYYYQVYLMFLYPTAGSYVTNYKSLVSTHPNIPSFESLFYWQSECIKKIWISSILTGYLLLSTPFFNTLFSEM